VRGPKKDGTKKDLLQNALRNVEELLHVRSGSFWEPCFLCFSKLPKARRKLKSIAQTGRKDQILSYLAEIWYALIFRGLGFDVEVEPLGRKRAGPDLMISRDGAYAFVEIRYFANVNANPPRTVTLEELRQDDFLLEPYGNPARDQQMVHDRILEKLRQLGADTSILALWNEKEDMEELETECAIRQIGEEVSEGEISVPDNFLFIVYGSAWWGRHQFYCYPLRERIEPYWQWMHELGASSATALIKRALDTE
jgi:hypothetical protein